MNAPADWIVPDWPAPARVKALITTRNGGVSRGPYASLNLGLHTGDDSAAVHANRAALLSVLPQTPRWLAQQHGSTVVEADDIASSPAADAGIARQPGTVCAILVADCIPVLFTDRAGTMVAAAHAGWRGLAGGVIEQTVQRTGASPAEILAYLGPGIGPRAFEVGADVRSAFVDRDPVAASAFAPLGQNKWLADLYALARSALARAGVNAIYGGGFCTVSDPQRFYSYRRDRVTGRMAALIWRLP
ncbi:MAG: peptidoglycan editing factor PgeF [Betaproteobacteria bacterium]